MEEQNVFKKKFREQKKIFVKVQGVKCPKKKFREQKEHCVKIQGVKCLKKSLRSKKKIS